MNIRIYKIYNICSRTSMSFIIYKEQVVELLKDARSMLRIPSYKVETALWVACIYIYIYGM